MGHRIDKERNIKRYNFYRTYYLFLQKNLYVIIFWDSRGFPPDEVYQLPITTRNSEDRLTETEISQNQLCKDQVKSPVDQTFGLKDDFSFFL